MVTFLRANTSHCNQDSEKVELDACGLKSKNVNTLWRNHAQQILSRHHVAQNFKNANKLWRHYVAKNPKMLTNFGDIMYKKSLGDTMCRETTPLCSVVEAAATSKLPGWNKSKKIQ